VSPPAPPKPPTRNAEVSPKDLTEPFIEGADSNQWALKIELTVTARELDVFITDPNYLAHITAGKVTTEMLSKGAPKPTTLDVTGGTFCLLQPDRERSDGWRMIYSLVAKTVGGHEYTYEGFKTVQRGSLLHAWPELSTLYTTVYDGEDVVALGIVKVSFPGFLSLLKTMKVVPPERRSGSRLQRYRFMSAFLRRLVPAFGPWPLGESVAFNSIPPKAIPRSASLPLKATLYCHGDFENPSWDERDGDDVWLKLRHYGTEPAGPPVMVTHGLLMSTAAYLVTTIHQNLTEYLLDRGYDVWLFDYRASTDLPSARSNFTLDDVANQDWPTAVAKVVELTRSDVNVVGHCMGSLTFQMAVLAGLEHVRSAVCSQVTLHIVAPRYNRLTAKLRVAKRLKRFGFRTIQPETINDGFDRFIDLLLRLNPYIPEGQRCSLAVCRWVTAFCGPTHRHEQLNLETHRDIVNLFGPGDLKALSHIALMIRKGHAVDFEGNDAYLRHPGRMKVPIRFLAGLENKIFLPEGSKRTIEWLKENKHYQCDRVELEQYAHLDGFIGQNAPREVFPKIGDFLDKFQPGPLKAGPASPAADPAGS
jgi:cholesterol oxidase